MSFALNPYWQTFSAPWRQRKTEKAFGFVIAMAVFMGMCWLLLLFIAQFDRKAILTGVGVTLVFVSHVFLLLSVSSAMAYNRPVCVLTVPGYLKVQRRTLMASWAVAVLVQWLGLILVREHGSVRISENNLLLLVIFVACSLFAPLVLRFYNWFFVLLLTSTLWLPRLKALWLQALPDVRLWPVWNAYDWLIAPLVWGTLAWAVSVWVLRPGDARHRASAQLITGLRAAMRGNYWGQGTRQTHSTPKLDELTGFRPVSGWAFNRRLATAQPTPESVLDRAELGFAPIPDFRRGLVLAAFIVVFGAMVVWSLSLGRAAVDPNLAGFMVILLAEFIAGVPFMTWQQLMKRTPREQGLLMLVPGMPNGNILARRLARRVLQSAAMRWALMVLVLAIQAYLGSGGPMLTWLAWGMGLANLLSLPFLARDWAHVRPQNASSQVFLVAAAFCAGVVLLAIAMAWSGWPIALWVVTALAATLGHLAWRWSRLTRMGQPLPVGRSVA